MTIKREKTYYKKHMFERDDDFLDRVIGEKFSSWLLNNTKWVKLIDLLVKHSSQIKECKVQPVWDENDSPSRKLRIDENVQQDFDFYDNAMESMVSGNPHGWYVYREIERLDFPHITETGETQDLKAIAAILDQAGEWVIELSSSNLRLVAYYRK